MKRTILTALLLALALQASPVSAADWPMFGRDRTRNAVSHYANGVLYVVAGDTLYARVQKE
jgi:endonuclease YncB( thermonuclease family)